MRMVESTMAESGERWGVISRVARQLGVGEQTLRNWVERAEIDTGRRPGTTTEDRVRIAELGPGSFFGELGVMRPEAREVPQPAKERRDGIHAVARTS